MEARAIYDFRATSRGELSFSKGAVLKVLNMEEHKDWYKAELEGREGYVPCNYIEMKPHPWYIGKMSRKQAEEMLLRTSWGNYLHPDGSFVVRLSETSPFDFSLSVKVQNAVVHYMIMRDSSGKYCIWKTKFNSLNELINFHRTSTVDQRLQVFLVGYADADKAEETFQVTCKFDFVPRNKAELGFRKGDIITIVDRVDDKWWRGKLHGVVGLFPVNYVEALNR